MIKVIYLSKDQKKGIKILSLDDWFKNYKPYSPILHWKEGRSAMEFARLMVDSTSYLPKVIEDVIKDLTEDDSFYGIGEYVTNFSSFNLGIGNGRNHDFFMHSNDLVVSIEAKVDEPFDLYMDETINETLNQNKRYNGLCQLLFNEDADQNGRLRYQLISGAAATILEAKERLINKAIFLIVVLKKPGYFDDKKIEVNNKDLKEFMLKLQCNEEGLVKRKYGPEGNISLYIRKIEIDL